MVMAAPVCLVMKFAPQHIVFDTDSGIGDTVQYVPAVLLLRQMYPQAEIVLSANPIAAQLFANCNFIDRIFMTYDGPYEERFGNYTHCLTTCGHEDNPQLCDLAIINHRRSRFIKQALALGVKEVVTHSYLPALYTPRLHFTPWYPRTWSHEIFHYQLLIKTLDPKRYRQCLAAVDLKKARIQPDDAAKQAIDAFLQKTLAEVRAQAPQAPEYQHLVLINPQSYTSERKGYNLKHEDFVALGEYLAPLYPQCLFVITSTGDHPFHHIPLQAPNLKLFINEGSLLHLVALIQRAHLVLTPSTGPAHLADNAGVDVCGVYPYYDVPRWNACGINLLLKKQAKLRGEPYQPNNVFAQVPLQKGWQERYDEFKMRYFKFCADFIAQHTLRLPPAI